MCENRTAQPQPSGAENHILRPGPWALGLGPCALLSPAPWTLCPRLCALVLELWVLGLVLPWALGPCALVLAPWALGLGPCALGLGMEENVTPAHPASNVLEVKS